MDFAIRVFASFRIAEGVYFNITSTTLSMLVASLLLIVLGIAVNVKSKNWKPEDKPSGLQNLIEMLVDAFQGFFRGSASEKLDHLQPWFFTLFAFLLTANMIGVIGLRPPTADWSVTFPLALASFVLFQYAGLRYRPKNYLKGFLQPVFVFLPLNLLGEFARPIALSFRIFGNVLGGFVLLSLLYGIAPIFLRPLFPVALHLYFDIASGFLQAFIFTVLSLTFVGLAAED